MAGVDETVGVGNEKAVGVVDQELGGGKCYTPFSGILLRHPLVSVKVTFVRPVKGSHPISTRGVGHVVLLVARMSAKIRKTAHSFHAPIGMNFSSPRA